MMKVQVSSVTGRPANDLNFQGRVLVRLVFCHRLLLILQDIMLVASVVASWFRR